jgi:hypothetical protein
MPTTIDVREFGAVPGGDDCTAALVRAAAACRGTRDATLLLPPGRYAISRARGSETWHGISNHEPTVARRVALHLVGCEGLTVSARGAELVASGQVTPLLIEGGRDVAVEGLEIDWATPLHAWAESLGGWNGWMDLRPVGGHPWRVVRERLCFLVDGHPEECWGTYGIDPAGMVPAERSGDNCGSAFTIPWVAEDLGGGVVRLRTHVVTPPPAGHLVILRHGARIAPGLCASGVDGLRISDVAIRQAGGMALIAQRCRDPLVERLRVTAGAGRPLSANHDATHFLSCRGTVRLRDSVLERQLDDATNIHGMNLPIVERVGARGLVARLGHIEQRGCIAAVPGERFAVVEAATMRERGELTAATVRQINAEFIELEAAGALPDAARAGAVLESVDADAGAEVTGCAVAHNRARGLLFSCRGRVLVADNRFESPGPAIHLHGDTNSWHESGAVPEIAIRGNRFTRCGYAREPRWGGGVVSIQAEIKRFEAPYHGRVVLEDNDFERCLLPPVDARGAAEVVARRNRGLVGIADVVAKECGAVSVG